MSQIERRAPWAFRYLYKAGLRIKFYSPFSFICDFRYLISSCLDNTKYAGIKNIQILKHLTGCTCPIDNGGSKHLGDQKALG
jgi:hypothetical protein